MIWCNLLRRSGKNAITNVNDAAHDRTDCDYADLLSLAIYTRSFAFIGKYIVYIFRAQTVYFRTLRKIMRRTTCFDRNVTILGPQAMKYLSLGLRALLTLAFVGAGGAKLAGVEMMVATYDAIGIGQWFRYLTGIIEIGAAALLWLPGRQALASALLGATMVGAVLAHVFILGPSAVPAVVVGLICAAVLYLHRDQINATLGRAA